MNRFFRQCVSSLLALATGATSIAAHSQGYSYPGAWSAPGAGYQYRPGLGPSREQAPRLWVEGRDLERLISGNTLMLSSRQGSRTAVYFSPDRRLWTAGSGGRPLEVGTWMTMYDQTCISGPQVAWNCFKTEQTRSGLEAWQVVNGLNLRPAGPIQSYAGNQLSRAQESSASSDSSGAGAAVAMGALFLLLLGAMTSGEDGGRDTRGSSDDSWTRYQEQERRWEREQEQQSRRSRPSSPDKPGDCFWGYKSNGTCVR